MLGEERETERLQTERGQKIARYTEIIGLCALELPKERSKPVHNTLVDTIFNLTSAIDLAVGEFIAEWDKEKNE